MVHPEDLQQPASASLRRPPGGRLRAYRPKGRGLSRLDSIRKALLRGELTVNALNRWRLSDSQTPGIHWTFTDPGRTRAVAETEAAVARREAGDIALAVADETTAQAVANDIGSDRHRTELLVAERDWSRMGGTCKSFAQLMRVAKQRGMAVHVIAALDPEGVGRDETYREARRIWRLQREPLAGPAPQTSATERRFGECLRDAGLSPIAQFPVARYYLDFAVIGRSSGSDGLPIRLDVEVDGRHWHEELPGRRGSREERRDRLLRLFGWRPVRFWTDEIEADEGLCVSRVLQEVVNEEQHAGR